jgi:MYXO-CTERM domain-containing protein
MKYRMVAIGLVFCSLFRGPAARAQTLTYGPILGRGVTPDHMIVKWGTAAQGDPSQISYRVKGAATFQTLPFAAARDHEGVLTGLTLGTTYEYYVTSGKAKSDTATFTTCPTPGLPMNMVFYGDSRSGMAEHMTVVSHLETTMPEMVFESGDIYEIGAYAGYLSEFFPVVKDLVATTPFMAAPGNHDALSGNLAQNYGLVFPMPRQHPGDPWEPYYAFTCGNAMFLSLNSNSVDDAVQQAFLSDRLNAASADTTVKHVFIWFHHGVYSPGEHGDTVSIQQSWVPLFREPRNKVTAVFNGHDHIYARMNDGSPVVYTVSGGAGAELYTDTGKSAATKVFAASTFNYVSLTVLGLHVSATAYNDQGMQIDSWSLTKAPPPDGGYPPEDLSVSVPDGGADGGSPPPGHGCSAGGTSGGAATGMWLVVLLWASRRRFRRQPG